MSRWRMKDPLRVVVETTIALEAMGRHTDRSEKAEDDWGGGDSNEIGANR